MIGETPRSYSAPAPGRKRATHAKWPHRRFTTWGDFDVVNQHGLMLTMGQRNTPQIDSGNVEKQAY